jgi:hypothetical protein
MLSPLGGSEGAAAPQHFDLVDFVDFVNLEPVREMNKNKSGIPL